MKSRGRVLGLMGFVCASLALWRVAGADTYKVDPVHSFALFNEAAALAGSKVGQAQPSEPSWLPATDATVT